MTPANAQEHIKVDTLIRAVGGLTVQEKGAWIADGRIIPWKAAGREVLGGLWQELVPPPPPGYATSLGMFHTHPLDQVPELSDEDRFFVFANNVDWQCVATGKGHVCECYNKGNEYRQASEIAKKIISGEYDMDILGQKFREFEALRVKTTTTNPQGIAEKKTVYIAGMPEAQKDNRARMQELGNLLREGGYQVTGRQGDIKGLPYLEYKAYAEDDLKNVAEWFNRNLSELSFEFKYETIDKFKKQITEMLRPTAEDRDRIELIIEELKEGTPPYAIFVDKTDNFILEGRHRIVAFYLHGLKKIPVYYVSLKASMPEAVKDNRARMQELGNLLREGGYEITGRGKFEIIYRGEGGTSHKGGRYWSPSAEWAKQFTQTGRIEEVKKAFIKSDDIYTAKELPYAGDPDAIDKAVAHAKNKGFKAVRLSEGTNEPPSVYVFDQTALKSVSAMAGVMETLTPRKEPWQMTKEEFAKTAIPLPDRKDFIKAWLKDNEDIPDLVKPGFNYIEQRNGSLLVFGNQRGHAIGIISMRKDVVEHIAVSDRYKDRGIATQLLEESRKYGVRRIIGAISPEVAGIVHRFTVRTAFLEGKPVPQEVLREYPDLMMKAEKQKWRR